MIETMVERALVRNTRNGRLDIGLVRGERVFFEEMGVEKEVALTSQVWPYIDNGPLEIVEMTETEVEATPLEAEEATEKREEPERMNDTPDLEKAHSELKKRYTKAELKELAAEHGFDLDARKNKDGMIGELIDELEDVADVFKKYL